MRATGPSPAKRITRRTALLAACAAPLAAGPAEDAWNLLARMAADLSANNGVGFLGHIDPRMPGYETLRANILALTGEASLGSSIDPISNQGDDRSRALEVDWILQITGRDNSAIFRRRHERVKCRAERDGKRWRVVALEPVSFFAPV